MNSAKLSTQSQRHYVALALLIVLSLFQCSCKYFGADGGRPAGCTKVNTVHVNRNAKTHKGVEEVTIVLYPGDCVNWRPVHDEDWHWELKDQTSVSPFTTGEKSLKKGDKDPGPATDVGPIAQAFPYTISVDNQSYDPQIVIMGR